MKGIIPVIIKLDIVFGSLLKPLKKLFAFIIIAISCSVITHVTFSLWESARPVTVRFLYMTLKLSVSDPKFTTIFSTPVFSNGGIRPGMPTN